MMYFRSNLPSVIKTISDKASALEPGSPLHDTMMRTIASTMVGELQIRIHSNGKAADGSDIGHYSTKPIYVSIKQNPGKSFGRPIGKLGYSKFKSGKRKGQDHTSRFFAGGYNEFKTAIGRNEIGKVNLSLSGQLNSQLSVQVNGNSYGIGWPDTEKLLRAKALEKKYAKKIWALSDSEKETVQLTATQFLKRAFS